MINKLKNLKFVNKKATWLGWFVTTHLFLVFVLLVLLIAVGINPTLIVSVIAAPLWIAVAFTSAWITDKILED